MNGFDDSELQGFLKNVQILRASFNVLNDGSLGISYKENLHAKYKYILLLHLR